MNFSIKGKETSFNKELKILPNYSIKHTLRVYELFRCMRFQDDVKIGLTTLKSIKIQGTKVCLSSIEFFVSHASRAKANSITVWTNPILVREHIAYHGVVYGFKAEATILPLALAIHS